MLRLQGYDYKVVYRPGKANIADALKRLNQTTPYNVSGDKIDFVKMVAVESTPSALSAKQVELESEKVYHKAQTLLENGGRSLLGARACRCHS